MTPEISVLMSTFNRGKTINRSIKSILHQTYTNFEFIICDDGSDDNTLKYLKYWANKDNRIKILINTYNQGLQISLNRCLKASTGMYIARMDDDDFSYPNRFKIQMKFITSHPNIAFVGSNIKLFNGNNIYGYEKFPIYPNKHQLFRRDEFCHPSILIRANILKEIGGYSTSLKFFRVEDYELWLRLYSLNYKGANIQQPLLNYRFNIHSNKTKFYDYYNRFRLLNIYKSKLGINFIGYFYVILPLVKLLTPHIIRNIIYLFKYNIINDIRI